MWKVKPTVISVTLHPDGLAAVAYTQLGKGNVRMGKAEFPKTLAEADLEQALIAWLLELGLPGKPIPFASEGVSL